jgi:hypothetical protein
MAADQADEIVIRTEGPTPAGGVYAIAYFRDDRGNPAPKDRATQVEIHEFSADGQELRRTYASLGRDDPTAE